MPVEHFLRGTTPYVRYHNSYGKVWEEPAEVAFFEASRRETIFCQIDQELPIHLNINKPKILTRRHGSLVEKVCRPESDLDILIIFSVLDRQDYIKYAGFWMRNLIRDNFKNRDVFCGVYHRPIFLDLFFAIFDQSTQQELMVKPTEDQ